MALPSTLTGILNKRALNGMLLNGSGVPYVAPPAVAPFPSFPPAGPTTLQQAIPAYLYQQYADDDDLQAFIVAYNSIIQSYIQTFNDLSLPVYTGALIVGNLLNWVALGLYGMGRPTTLSTGSQSVRGPLNTWALNTIALDSGRQISTITPITVTDDAFKRMLTWNVYLGDGRVFSIPWLKRRVKRFLIGTNGTAPNIDNTYDISVTLSGTHITITVPGTYPLAPILAQGIKAGILILPFVYSYTVNY